MQLKRTEHGFQIDAVALGPLLGVPAEDVQRLMREGRIASLYELPPTSWTLRNETCGTLRKPSAERSGLSLVSGTRV